MANLKEKREYSYFHSESFKRNVLVENFGPYSVTMLCHFAGTVQCHKGLLFKAKCLDTSLKFLVSLFFALLYGGLADRCLKGSIMSAS